MQMSVLEMIRTLRGGQDFTVDTHNRNRYCVRVKELYGGTAYCFSTPIYELQSRKLVNLQFVPTAEGNVFHGSHGCVTVRGNCVELKNDNGVLHVTLPSNAQLRPALNGIAVTAAVSAKKPFVKVKLRVDKPFLQIRANEKYFAFMQEEFRPFASLSALCAKGVAGFHPAKVAYEKLEEGNYAVTVSATGTNSAVGQTQVCFELNLYEPKLFQDTTVESRHPEENNAFGSVAFLGRTAEFGEQWLYSRPDFSKISEFYRVPVQQVLLHLPRYSSEEAKLAVFAPQARFCSFGSNWNNKIPHVEATATLGSDKNYYTIDITSLVVDGQDQTLRHVEGLILKPSGAGSGFAAVATGDNYDRPQILEIRYC